MCIHLSIRLGFGRDRLDTSQDKLLGLSLLPLTTMISRIQNKTHNNRELLQIKVGRVIQVTHILIEHLFSQPTYFERSLNPTHIQATPKKITHITPLLTS
jgi:hypothetical protein